GIAAYSVTPLILGDPSGGGAAEMVLAQAVTSNFFDVLRTRAVAGRTFLGEEGEPGGRTEVLVLGHGFWQRRFSGDPRIIGSTVRVSAVPSRVAGVAAEGCEGLMRGVSPAFYVPLHSPAITAPERAERRGSRGLFAVGRLSEGATLAQA